MNYKHITDIIKENAQRFSSKNAIFYKNISTREWIGMSWENFNIEIQKVSKALINFGINEQDSVAIFAQNMSKWSIADVGIMGARAVTVPIFATNSEKEVKYILNDAEVSVIFVGDQIEYDKALNVSEKSKYLKLIIAFNEKIELTNSENSVFYDDFINAEFPKSIETELKKRHYEQELDDLASILYTSGTTGEPKGVMLTHTNLSSSIKAHQADLNVDENDVSLSFLPLSHIYERIWVFFCLQEGVQVYYNKNPNLIAKVLLEVKPTLMCAVPRVFEKIYTTIQSKKEKAPKNKVKLMNWALETGNAYHNNCKRLGKNPSLFLKLKYKLATKLVLSKLQAVFGGNIKFIACGGAPLAADIVAYFHSAGLNVKCGYGLTETTATVTFLGDTHFEFNSVGKPLKGTEIKIGENNEILVKGPGVMKGYYKKPEETKKVFNNGWFSTGDAGKIDKDGNLVITDRIKDLMKTSGGKYIAPQKLESALISDAFIEQIAVIGDRKKYVTALAVPSFENIKKYATEQSISFKDIEELINHNQIKDLFEKRFKDLQKEFSGFEKIKKFTLLPQEFSIETGEITATLKLKRKVIYKKYKNLIDIMYKE